MQRELHGRKQEHRQAEGNERSICPFDELTVLQCKQLNTYQKFLVIWTRNSSVKLSVIR